MAQSVAFLRAINVGGHTVSMARLRTAFAELGFTGVETFIASGNVVFDTRSAVARALERKIEQHLAALLGYEVATFVRGRADVAAIAACQPFRPAEVAAAKTVNVALVSSEIDPVAAARLMALETEIDRFRIHGREIYWLCRTWQSESTFSNLVLERTIGQRATIRGVNTIRRLVAKYWGLEGARIS